VCSVRERIFSTCTSINATWTLLKSRKCSTNLLLLNVLAAGFPPNLLLWGVPHNLLIWGFLKSSPLGDSSKSPPKCTPPDSIFPTVPVHSVPNSGASAVERIHYFELNKYFGSRGLSDWTTLEHTGSGIHVIQDKDGPRLLGTSQPLPGIITANYCSNLPMPSILWAWT
jgi:hypothetical protein